ncbi:ZC12C-like protein [Mya arenaria]|uniref:ZC12C-like protein n=1 Tax=Mya arenaria TaxID=6604 RepID=A0ABY7EEP5_MYAAR|nr:ZC12C-like protein [Mya arenaria]
MQGNTVILKYDRGVHCDLQDAQEVLVKAKKYFGVLLDELPGLVTITDNFDPEIVSTVLNHKADIEFNLGCIVFTARGSQQSSSQHQSFEKLSIKDAHSVLYKADSFSEDEDALRDIRSSVDYQVNLEFAFKLGYNEKDLIHALRVLGQNASQNELLAELIKSSQSTEGTERPGSREEIDFEGEKWQEEGDNQLSQLHVDDADTGPFRHIIMDGSNVAMSHGSKEVFSCRGIQLAVDWFRERGHTAITVFVPQWRKETSRSDARIRDQQILMELEKEGIVVFTPSRRIGGKRVVCYDDRYILKLAVETDGIVVSNDNYRDLMSENEKFKKVVEERLLMYSFVNDRFMPPDDPLGRNGPTLDNFLLRAPASPEPLPPLCPYGSKKCTYGNKCKYYHPERRTQPHKLISEKLAEQAKLRMHDLHKKEALSQQSSDHKKLSAKMSLHRTRSSTPEENPPSKSSLSFTFGEPLKKSTKSDEKFLEYNQKLTESRLKMEQERLSNEKGSNLPSPRTPEKRDQRSLGSTENLDRSSPRFIEPRLHGMVSPRESSPVNLAIPSQYDISTESGNQKFLSGHLLLAKKLSDEANENDKMKKKGKTRIEDGTNVMSPLVYSPTKPMGENISERQSSIEKKKLSRQYSLQTAVDPRIAQRHTSLHQQLSYDPRRLEAGMQQSEFHGYPYPHQEFQYSNVGTGMNNFGAIERPKQKLSRDTFYGHTPLAKMQSAPDPYLRSHQSVKPTPRMMRQNSSSDTQLNKILSTHKHDNPIAESFVPRGPNDISTMVMQGTTGSVKFQIGGGPQFPQVPPGPYHSPMLSPAQGHDYRFQPPFSPEFHHQGPPYYPHTTLQVQTSHPQNPPQSQSGFHSPQQTHYVNQSSFWDSGSQPNIAGYHSTQQQISPGTVWPQTSSHSSPQLNVMAAPNQSSIGTPYPIDAPILRNDYRFKLYCDLCRLFPEEKVRAAMNQHPEANTANDVCAYLIGAK